MKYVTVYIYEGASSVGVVDEERVAYETEPYSFEVSRQAPNIADEVRDIYNETRRERDYKTAFRDALRKKFSGNKVILCQEGSIEIL